MRYAPPLIAFAFVLITGFTIGRCCHSEQSAPCYSSDSCEKTYCLGSDEVNPPVYPKTCDGDITITVEGLYWRAQQDGLEYAIHTNVRSDDTLADNLGLNNIVDGKLVKPGKHWEFGYKLGIGYNTPCDGWDLTFLWTRYHTSTSTHLEAEECDNTALLPLWSAYQSPIAGTAPVLFARDITTHWGLELNLYDLELGRAFWTSKRLSLRPYIGLRGTTIDQSFKITHRGGSWTIAGSNMFFNDFVRLSNDYKGVGLRSGLITVWNLDCGWAFYGDLGLSIIYGRFNTQHFESIRETEIPFGKTRIYKASEHFRVSRPILDLALGLQWSFLTDCQYWLFQLGWEQHLFFDQNQLWRTQRFGGFNDAAVLNNSGENVYFQRRGDLSTEGLTLRVTLGF